MDAELSDEQLEVFARFVADSTGLHFPQPRWPDLRRGIASAARVMGRASPADCVRWLLSCPLSRTQIDVLASHLTVGETYFFRDPRAFEILSQQILPELLIARRPEKRLRIWSAACCTGEEPYSIAIQLLRSIPDLHDWNVSLLASDINPEFLARAEAGIYGKWSFRDAPPWLVPQYFRALGGDRFEILPRVRRLVRFAQLNLMDDVYPSLANDTNALDLIFCRNVLMYFSPAAARKVIANLHRCQVEDGWLLVGASELLQVSSTPYASAHDGASTVFRKSAKHSRSWSAAPAMDAPAPLWPPVAAPEPEPPPAMPIPMPAPVPAQPTDAQPPDAQALYESGQYEQAAGLLQREDSTDAIRLGLRTRCLANLGRLGEAMDCCRRWSAVDKLNPSAHYLLAILHQEQGQLEAAWAALRTALYAEPNFALAHFAMGNLSRRNGRPEESRRHFRNALDALRHCPPEQALPESDGITAARLAQIIASLLSVEAAA